MVPRRSRLVTIVVLGLCLAAGHTPVGAQGTPQLPSPQGRVNDFAQVLDADAEVTLDQLLRGVEDRTTAEIAVATVPTLQGLTVEDYAERLFRIWGIGQARVDNGVLVLVAPTEREMRIEVGYGLEGVLPDGLAGDVIRNTFIPRFREDDYQGGILAGVRRVAEIVERNHVLTPEERRAIEEAGADRVPMWFTLPFFGVFITIGAFLVGMGFGEKVGFYLIFGGGFSGLPLLMSLIPFFNAPVWILGPWALVMAGLGYWTGRRSSGRTRRHGEHGRDAGEPRRGWVMGGHASGSSGSSGFGSSSSSSGSSFGGGSSGGGGASGRW